MTVSRRRFIQSAGVSGAFLLARFQGLPLWAGTEAPSFPCLLRTGSGYAPFLDEFVEHLQPGKDAFITEQYAAELEAVLETWRAALCSSPRDLSCIAQTLTSMLDAAMMGEATITTVRSGPPIESGRADFPASKDVSSDTFLASLRAYLAPMATIETAEFRIYGIQVVGDAPLHLDTQVRYNLAGSLDGDRREQRTGSWSLRWQKSSDDHWKILAWAATTERRVRLTGAGFVDITTACLAGNISYEQQMERGLDHWRTVLDGASGIDIYGNNGVAAGDFDGDGFDDFYVCQPAGLPNRLYRNRGDGTFEDVTEKAGVGILDGTSCAIFADLNNNGHQDLIVVHSSGPLLYVNRGDGVFELKQDAFHFATPPKGTFTGIAVADYDRDGLLDVYFCLYSLYEGISQYQYPSPYYDAQNGPPNFLLKNRGEHTFEDVTLSSGMNVSNERFSFACSWNDYNQDGWPDLYVVNDFGRKVLYRNNGNGTFTDVSAETGVEDPGEGMSMTWLDYDNDGFEDLYVVNMWEPAGLRVMTQNQFLPHAPEAVRKVYRQDAMGNTLLHKEGGKGTFREVTEASLTGFGGWNWGSDAWDFDHDGYPDMYVANGFISGPQKDDLSSFFWRQVVSRSYAGKGKSQGYEDAWNAINEFIRSDHSWSGYQRNNFYLNNRNGSFTEAAGVLGLDFLDDSRAFALADLNHDGRLEVILKNRTAPQFRILQNQLNPLGFSISFRLKGTRSNRDAIGAVVELKGSEGRQRKSLSAGSGFLMQHTKDLYFGLGPAQTPVSALVRWPSGVEQPYDNLPAGNRIEIVEGFPDFKAVPFAQPKNLQPSVRREGDPISADGSETWLVEPIIPPYFSLPDAQGKTRRLKDHEGQPLILAFWQDDCEESQRQLQSMQRLWPECQQSKVQMLAIRGSDPARVAGDALPDLRSRFSYPVCAADKETLAVYNIFHRYLFERRRDMPLPTAFLINSGGAVIKLYSGYTDCAHILQDWQSAPVGTEATLRKALPFPGQYLGTALHHNYFTYGVALLRYGYPDRALLSFQQAIERNPSYSAAYYNVGLIYLNQHKLDEAQTNLNKAIELDPSNANVWNNLGVARGESRDYSGALTAFQKALALQPSHFLAVQNIVKVYNFQGRSDDARQLLESAIAAEPDEANLHMALGMLLVQKNDMVSARKEFENAVRLEPKNPEALNGLGVVLMRSGETANAIKRFEECRQLAPAVDRAYLNLALIYVHSGDKQKALDVLNEYPLSQHDSPEIRKALEQIGGLR